MSANNWRECPQCRARDDKRRLAARLRAEASYGKVSAAEYERLKAEAAVPDDRPETLREDWQLGMDRDGTFRPCPRGERLLNEAVAEILRPAAPENGTDVQA